MSLPSTNHSELVSLLAQVDANTLLAALSEAKAGKESYEDFLPMRLYEGLEVDLDNFIKALEEHKAQRG
jgi:hypothetical protein